MTPPPPLFPLVKHLLQGDIACAYACSLSPVVLAWPIPLETMTTPGWDEAYAAAPAPWDIGRPQSAFQRLAERGLLAVIERVIQG